MTLWKRLLWLEREVGHTVTYLGEGAAKLEKGGRGPFRAYKPTLRF